MKNQNRPKTIYFFFLASLMGFIGLQAQNVPKSYVVYKSLDTLHIDGKGDERSWKMAQWSDDFIDIEGVETPKYRTRMKILRDDTYLYVFAELEEPHVWGTLKQRDTIIFHNNDFEIFIDPDGDTHSYYEFEMNVLNTVWDLFLTTPYRNGANVINSWYIEGLKTAVHIDGTLNNPKDSDTGWSVEIAIPWSEITEASRKKLPPENEYWRFNFSRVNWNFDLVNGRYSRKKDSNGKRLPEYNWVWSPQGVINMHEPEHWGYVYFSDKSVGQQATFDIPEDEYIKWYLYGLYRNLLHNDREQVVWKMVGGKTHTEPQKILGKPIVASLEKVKGGFVLWAESPFSKKILSIRDDGKFRALEKE